MLSFEKEKEILEALVKAGHNDSAMLLNGEMNRLRVENDAFKRQIEKFINKLSHPYANFELIANNMHPQTIRILNDEIVSLLKLINENVQDLRNHFVSAR